MNMATTISAIPASVVISRIGYVHYKKLIREKRIELVRTARFPYEALVKNSSILQSLLDLDQECPPCRNAGN